MMITVETAQSQILSAVTPLPPQSVAIRDALGRVLAEALIADQDIPHFDNTAMDGYAVQAADTQAANPDHPVPLRVIGVVAAGHPFPATVAAGTAAKIMTGAPMPAGADAVVQVEWTHTDTDASQVWIDQPVSPGQNLRYRGGDMRQGGVIVSPGHVLSPAMIGIAVTVNYATLQVFRQPTVAIVATGDELVEPGQPLPDGSIRNSNSYALAAAVQQAGGIPWLLPPAPDRLDAIEDLLDQAIASADLVVSSGGVSVGDFDLVKTALQRRGSLDFWRVAMKPGKPIAFGRLHDKLFFGLPGNPVSALVTFELFVRPVIRQLQGDPQWQRPQLRLPLATAFQEISDRRHYVRVQLRPNPEGELAIIPNPLQDSHIQTSWLHAKGLMVVEANQGPLPASTRMPVLLLD